MAVRIGGPELSEFGGEAVASRARDAQLETLYQAYAQRVRALARRRLGDVELADDAVQETFLNAYRALESLDPTRPAWPWLARIAGNVCVDLARQRQSRPDCASVDLSKVADAAAAHTGDPAARYFASEDRRAIAAALGGVCQRQRRVLMLREVEGWRYEDIAVLEGMSLDALKGALKRARQNFRKAYAAVVEAGGALGVALSPRRAWRWLRMRSRGAVDRVQEGAGPALAWSSGPLAQVSGFLAAATLTLAVVAVIAGGPRPGPAPASPAASSYTTASAAGRSSLPPTAGVPAASGGGGASSGVMAVAVGTPPAASLPAVGATAIAGRSKDPNYSKGVAIFIAETPMTGPVGTGVGYQIKCAQNATYQRACDVLNALPGAG